MGSVMPSTSKGRVMPSIDRAALRATICIPMGDDPHNSGPIQWARGDVGLKPSASFAEYSLAFTRPFCKREM